MNLRDILATELLTTRAGAERPDVATVLAPFAETASSGKTQMWDAVSAHILKLCRGDSAGISIFADPRYDELTWVSAAGELAPFRMRRFPRRHSLCGVVLERKSVQLFVGPHRYFQWIAQAGVNIAEAVVVPLTSGEHIYGTIWVMTHYDGHKFTATDANMLAMVGEAMSRYLATHCGAQPTSHALLGLGEGGV